MYIHRDYSEVRVVQDPDRRKIMAWDPAYPGFQNILFKEILKTFYATFFPEFFTIWFEK